MPSPERAIILFTLFTSLVVGVEPDARADDWMTDFEEARQLAERLDQPLLVHLYADWCIPCKRMDQNVLHAAAVVEQFGDGIVAVKLNGEFHRFLVKQYQVNTYPADLVFDSAGKLVGKNEGALTLEEYTRLVANSRDHFRSVADGQNASVATRGNVDAAHLQPVLGLDGYCPVSLKSLRKWQVGSSDLTATYKSIEYRMVSKEALMRFQMDPQKYAPRILGCDPVTLSESHVARPGHVKYGAFFDGALYLFESGDNRIQFRENPLKYTRVRHAIKSDEVIRMAEKS